MSVLNELDHLAPADISLFKQQTDWLCFPILILCAFTGRNLDPFVPEGIDVSCYHTHIYGVVYGPICNGEAGSADVT